MVELALAPGENRLEESMSRCFCGCESDIGMHTLSAVPCHLYNCHFSLIIWSTGSAGTGSLALKGWVQA